MSHTTPAICNPAYNLCAGPPTCQPSSLQYLPPNSGYSTISSQYNTYPQSYTKNSALLSGLSNMTGLGQSTLGTTTLGQSSLGQSSLGQSGLGSLGQTSLGQSALGQSALGQTNMNQLGQTGIVPNYSSSCPMSNTTFSHPLVSNNPTSLPSYNCQPYTNQVTNALNPTYSLPYNPATTFSNNVTFSNPLSAQFNNPMPLSGAGGLSIKLKPLEETDIGATRRVATPCTPHPPTWGLGGAMGLTDTRPLSRMLPDGLDTEWGLHSTDRIQYLNGHSSEGQVDMLDIPGKGRCSVYIAR